MVSVQFRIRDQEENACELHTFEYTTDGGLSWQQPTNLDLSGALSAGWTDNNGSFYGSSQDWSGTLNNFWFDTLSFDVTGFAGIDQSDVAIRFFVNDGIQDSDQPVASELFRVDNEPPIGSIQVDNNEAYCTSQSVIISISSQDSVSMCFSNDGQTYSDWETFDFTKQWQLTSGDGRKTVYVKFIDENGNISISSDGIILDASSPNGSIKINNGEALTRLISVTLMLESSSAVSMCFSNDDQTYSAWEPFAASKNWELESGDGEKIVYVKYRDIAGNAVTANDSISLDTVAPSGTLSINGGNEYTNSIDVTLSIDSVNTAYICFSNDDQNYTDWEPYSKSKSWSLLYEQGVRYANAKLRDEAGNIGIISDTIILDTTPPAAPTLEPIGTTDNILPIFRWDAVNDGFYYILQYSNEPNFDAPTTVDHIGPSEYETNVPLDDGDWYWRVKAVDLAGNKSEWSQVDHFILDTIDACNIVNFIPILISPANGQNNVSLRPEMQIQHPDGLAECNGDLKIRWRISKNQDFKSLVASVNSESKDMTTYQPSELILDPNTTYYWQVRYIGTNHSAWSDVYAFTTRDITDDQNSNGIPDDSEVGDDTDLNDDGVSDNKQVGMITSVRSKKGNKEIGIETNRCVLTWISVGDEQDIADYEGKPDEMPFGLIGYKVNVQQFGETVTVIIHLSEPAPEGAKWVFYDPIDGWQDYSAYATFNKARDEITLELKDGGYGDKDHTENMVIVDPSGIGIYYDESDGSSETVVSGSSGGSGGCFISSIIK